MRAADGGNSCQCACGEACGYMKYGPKEAASNDVSFVSMKNRAIVCFSIRHRPKLHDKLALDKKY